MSNGNVTPANGISGGYQGDNKTILRAMMAFTAIAWYNSIELIILVLFFFKRYSGLYFWSLIITSISIIPYALGAWMTQVRLISAVYVSVTLSTVGWMVMVTGQSLVLYSRLHLVTQNERLLRAVLWLILVDAFALYVPTAVLTYGSQTSDRASYLPGYEVMEKIQMTIFSVQEFIISGVYLWEVRKILKVVYEGRTRNLMWELIAINVVIIVLDVALLTVEFLNYYQIETTIKGMVYSVKLKLEFGVLSKLVNIVSNKAGPSHMFSYSENETGFCDGELAEHEPSASFFSSRWHSNNKAPKKTSTAGVNGNTAEHLEFASRNALESHDWSKGSEPPMHAAAGAPEMPEQPRKRPSRRSSISEMYPGKLG